jgi:hypothetical protein
MEANETKFQRTKEPKNQRRNDLCFGSSVLRFFGSFPGSSVLWFLILCAAPAGCRWNQFLLRRPVTDAPPVVFSALPSAPDAVAAVNANTQRVRSLQTQGATISVPGAPSINAEIAVERPARLRLRAATQLTGPELDLGSNEQLFWVWAARMPQASVYFARHDQFAASRARQMFPIEPTWLIQALGLVEIDPASVIDGPHTAAGGRVQLRTSLAGPIPYTRMLVLDSKYAWVLEQHVYDQRGQLIASARNSQFEFQPFDSVSLPKRIEVQMPGGPFSLQLDINRWAINQPLGDSQTLFDLPRSQLNTYPFIDLADPNFVPPGGTLPASQPTPRNATAAQENLLSRIRGYSPWR